jgi:hypothetical protein
MSSSPLRKPGILSSLMEVAEPIAVIPPADKRRWLRTAAGIPPQTAAAVLGVGINTIRRWERAMVSGPAEKVRTFGNRDDYGKLLRVCQAWVNAHPEAHEQVEEDTSAE